MKKNITRRLMTALLAAAMCVSMAACGSKTDDTKTDGTGDADGAKKYTIGVCQLVTHDALDAATQGFIDAVKDKLGEENVTIDVQNAANDQNVCTTIVNTFVSKKVDLIMANATPALQAAYNATAEIPILGTSVTEYGVALGIDNFSGTVGGNVSGTSDLAPLTEQADMILELLPETKTVGLLYCSAEPNSEYQVQVVEEYLTGKGITCTRYSFSDSNDVAAVTTKAAADSDVIYIPTDNTAASCTETIGSIVLNAKTPVVAGEKGLCTGCGGVHHAAAGRAEPVAGAAVCRAGRCAGRRGDRPAPCGPGHPAHPGGHPDPDGALVREPEAAGQGQPGAARPHHSGAAESDGRGRCAAGAAQRADRAGYLRRGEGPADGAGPAGAVQQGQRPGIRQRPRPAGVNAKPGTAREDSPRLSALDGLCGGWYDGGQERRGRSGAGEDAMKKIDNCENSTVLVALLLAGILLVMGAYRLFSWLCSRGLTDTLTWVLGAAALVLAALGLLLASRSFRRLKELHL